MDLSWALRSCERLYLFPKAAKKSEIFNWDPGQARAETGLDSFQSRNPEQVLQLVSVMAREPYVYVIFWFSMEADAISFNATLGDPRGFFLVLSTLGDPRDSFLRYPRGP